MWHVYIGGSLGVLSVASLYEGSRIPVMELVMLDEYTVFVMQIGLNEQDSVSLTVGFLYARGRFSVVEVRHSVGDGGHSSCGKELQEM